jgi:hypothetical protein
LMPARSLIKTENCWLTIHMLSFTTYGFNV